MLSKFMKALYFILIVLVTFITISFAEVNKLEKYLKKKEAISSSDNYELIQNLTITKNNKYPKAYIYKDPLFNESYTLKDDDGEVVYSFDLYLYKYIESAKRKNNNGLAIILKNLNIFDDSKTLLESQQPLIDIDISYDDEVKTTKENHFASIYPRDTFVLLINYDLLIVNDSYVNIKDITFKYETKGSVFKDLITLKNEDISDATIKDKLGDVNRDIKVLESNNIIDDNININNIKNDSNYIHNSNLKKDLNKENSIYIKYIFIELLFVIPITYFLFFHKDVLRLRKIKKEEKAKRIKKIKKDLIEERENKE